MIGRIRHLDCRWEVVGDPRCEAELAPPLERLVQHAAPAALEGALDELLGDDPTLYVLRHLRIDMVWTGQEAGDPLARAWARALTRETMRAIAGGHDGANVVRFDDEADFAARFLADLAAGNAWEHWYYSAYADLRPLGRREAARELLLGAGRDAAAVLAGVHRRGALPALLALVDDDATLRRLWAQGRDVGDPSTPTPSASIDGAAAELARPPSADESPWWPVFLAALRVADALALWRERRPPTEALWRDFAATRPLPPSWRDRGELTQGVLVVLVSLRERRSIRAQPPAPRRLAAVLAELDWLDTDMLRERLDDTLAAAPLPTPNSSRAPTPRQRELLADLLRALPADPALLDRPDPAAAALLLHALLTAVAPRWRYDPMARAMIEHLLAAARLLAASPAGLAERRHAGDANGALARLPAARRAAAEPACRFLARLGPQAVAVATALVTPRRGAAAAIPPRVAGPPGAATATRAVPPRGATAATTHSQCAGVFLLLRAALDVRLPALADEVGYPPGALVLAALAQRWGGTPATARGRADPGLALLPGAAGAVDIGDLNAAWAATPPSAHRRWRAALAAQVALPGRADAARALPALAAGRLGVPAADAALTTTAIALLRAWAQWLRGFSDSSVVFLLDRFVRRPGELSLDGDDIVVRFERRPLDVVLRLAGYLDELRLAPLGGTGALRLEVADG